MKRIMNNKGMSLIELIGALIIFGIICAPMAIFIHSIYTGFSENMDKLKAGSIARTAVSNIMTDLSKYKSIYTTVNDENTLFVGNDSAGRGIYYIKDSNKGLIRQVKEGGNPTSDVRVLVEAKNLDSVKFSEVNGQVINMVISVSYREGWGRNKFSVTISDSYRKRMLP